MADPASPPPDYTTAHMIRVARRLITETIPRHWKTLLLSLLCIVGVAGFTGGLAASTKLIVDDVFSSGAPGAALRVALIIAGITMLKAGFQYANEVIVIVLRRGISVSFQKALFAHTLRQDMAYFGTQQPAGLMFVIQNLGSATGGAFVNICNRMVVEALTVVALFVVMLLQDPILTLICSACVPLIIGLVAALSARVRRVATSEAGFAGLYFAIGTEILRGIKTVKSYQLEDKSRRRFDGALSQLENLLFRFARITTATIPLVEFLGGLVIGLFVIFASWQVSTSEATPGEFTAFLTAFLMAYKPAERLSNIWVEVQKGLVFVARLYEMLDETPQVQGHGTETLDDPRAPLVLDGVSFSYGPGQPAITDISLALEPAERIAVVGQSGAGKSTLIDIIQRFRDPHEGTVRLGEMDLQRLDERALRDHIAYISQDVFLFDGTIAENIADGCPDASRAEIETAARLAGLGALIDQLPEGLDAPIGPNGNALSGGQRQRLGIARGIAKRAGLYIFDEVTSALDAQTEREVMAALTEHLKDATLIFITHRAATLDYVDRVLVLDNGQVDGFAPPETLLRESPAFRLLFGAQEMAPADASPEATANQP